MTAPSPSDRETNAVLETRSFLEVPCPNQQIWTAQATLRKQERFDLFVDKNASKVRPLAANTEDRNN